MQISTTLAEHELKDMVLDASTQERIEMIIRQHNRSDVLRDSGLNPSSKLLFYGPSGCGKTMAAEAMANALSMPLLMVRPWDVVADNLAVTQEHLREIFLFIEHHPVVAVFDEFEVFSLERGMSACQREVAYAVGAAMSLMGACRTEGLIVFTANYEVVTANEVLAEPQVRNRFDETIRFGYAQKEQFQRLLSQRLSGIRHDLDVEAIARQRAPMTHAAIARATTRAIKRMLLSGNTVLTQQDLDAAFAQE